MKKYVILVALAATPQVFGGANSGGPNSAQSMALGQPGTNLYNCAHPNLPNSKQACDAIILANDYNSMVQLCSSGLTYSGQNGTVDFCGQLSNAPASSLTKAIDNNSNGKGVQLEYICMHPTAHGMTQQLAQQACNLLSEGVEGGSYNAAMGAIEVCTSGVDESLCQALARQASNQNVVQAIGDNSNGKGVQLGYIVMHPTAQGATAQKVLDAGDLLVQGLNGDNVDAATSVVQICVAGISKIGSQGDNPCTLIANKSNNPNVVQAIGNLAGNGTGSNVLLGYRCEHANLVGSTQACTLLGQATAAGNYQAAFAAVHACAAGVAPQLCTVIAGVANNPNIIQAIGDNSNGKGIDLGAVCKQTKNKSEATAACTILALGVAGNYDAAVSGIQTCITGTAPADSLCKVLQAAGINSNVAKAIDDNSVSGSLNLGNTCMKGNLPGHSAACGLLGLGVENDMPNASYAAVQACASGHKPTLCQMIAVQGGNPAVAKAIGDNSGTGQGVELDNTCLHGSNLPGAAEACGLLAQGAAGDINAADGAVQVCASGLADEVCSALSAIGATATVKSAINNYANDNNINLQYRCGHANEAGSAESCALLKLAGISVPGSGNAGGSIDLADLSYNCSHAANSSDSNCQQIAQAAWAGNEQAIEVAQELCGQQKIDKQTCTAIIYGKIQSGVVQQEPTQTTAVQPASAKVVPAQPVAPVVAPVAKPAAPVVAPATSTSSAPSASQIQAWAQDCSTQSSATATSCANFSKLLLAGNQTAISLGKGPCEQGPLMWADGCSKVGF